MRTQMKHNNIKGIIYASIMILSMLFMGTLHNMCSVQPPMISTESRKNLTYSSQYSSLCESSESTIPETNNVQQVSSVENSNEHIQSVSVASKSNKVEQANREYYDVPLSYDLQNFIFSECESKNVPPDLVIALIDVESDFNPKLISKTNDYGLMQINICHKDSLKKTLQITDLIDEKQNIKAGVYMLSEIVNKYSNVNQALMVYNCGEFGAKKLWNNGVYSTNYSKKVIKKIDEIKS